MQSNCLLRHIGIIFVTVQMCPIPAVNLRGKAKGTSQESNADKKMGFQFKIEFNAVKSEFNTVGIQHIYTLCNFFCELSLWSCLSTNGLVPSGHEVEPQNSPSPYQLDIDRGSVPVKLTVSLQPLKP